MPKGPSSRSAEAPNATIPRIPDDSVFKPGMGEDLENCCERVGGNSKNRDQGED
jgi:hypothetical protein